MFSFIPPENTRRPKIFWCFQGVYNGNIGQKWVKNTKDDVFTFLISIEQGFPQTFLVSEGKFTVVLNSLVLVKPCKKIFFNLNLNLF